MSLDWQTFTFRPMDRASIEEFLAWRYEPPYDIYDIKPPDVEAEINYFLDPSVNGHLILDGTGNEILALVTFGHDGQVPGGDYTLDALDIGMGVRPDLTGRGLGFGFVQAVLGFGRSRFAPPRFRVTIASFNKRAQNVWLKAGFQQISAFMAKHNRKPFVILVREETPADLNSGRME